MKKTNLILIALAGAFLAYGFMGPGQSKVSPSNIQAEKQGSAAPARSDTGTQIGNFARDLSYMNPEGKAISLSSFKGKVVLLDFWASWCRPCRMENPNVVKAYNKYKDSKFKNGKGFTVVGVSLDMNKDAWINAITQDKLTWDLMSDLGGWNSAPAHTYGVQSIPTNFLLDGNGKIIATNLRGEALDAELEKYKSK